MSDFYATEKIIGGAVFVGVGSLLTWSVSQTGDGGMPGLLFSVVSIFGALWVIVGLFELIAGRRWNRGSERIDIAPGEAERTSP